MENIKEYSLKANECNIKSKAFSNSRDSFDYAYGFYFDDIEIYESMFLMLMDRQNRVTGYVKISQGGTAGTVCDIKLIALYAVKSLAQACILCHNHPSGNKKPSVADIDLTKKVKDGLCLLDISLLDHLIITKDNGYFSFADEGVL